MTAALHTKLRMRAAAPAYTHAQHCYSTSAKRLAHSVMFCVVVDLLALLVITMGADSNAKRKRKSINRFISIIMNSVH